MFTWYRPPHSLEWLQRQQVSIASGRENNQSKVFVGVSVIREHICRLMVHWPLLIVYCYTFHNSEKTESHPYSTVIQGTACTCVHQKSSKPPINLICTSSQNMEFSCKRLSPGWYSPAGSSHVLQLQMIFWINCNRKVHKKPKTWVDYVNDQCQTSEQIHYAYH